MREAAGELSAEERRLFTRIAWRLSPLLLLGYVLNYLDRSNIANAALTMKPALGLGNTEFGIGAGILFLSYCLFEVPSNMAMYRLGARLWLGRIMISWGLVSAATALVAGAWSFYGLRFLLGLAEAGFFPGVTYYLAAWFPAALRTRVLAWFLLGIPFSSVLGGLIAAPLLDMDRLAGLAGWQWLFIVEGLPASLVGVLALFLLADRPESAPWLSLEERRTVAACLARETRERAITRLLPSITDARVLMLAAIQFGFTLSSYGVGIWLPLVLKQQALSNASVSLITALVYLAAALGMLVWAGAVDRGARRIPQLVVTCALAAIGLVASMLAPSFALSLLAVTVALIGITAARAVFWTIPTRFLTGAGAAGGLAFINTIGAAGGFAGPFLVGWLKDTTGHFEAGYYAMAAIMTLTALLAFALRWQIRQE